MLVSSIALKREEKKTFIIQCNYIVLEAAIQNVIANQ